MKKIIILFMPIIFSVSARAEDFSSWECEVESTCFKISGYSDIHFPRGPFEQKAMALSDLYKRLFSFCDKPILQSEIVFVKTNLTKTIATATFRCGVRPVEND